MYWLNSWCVNKTQQIYSRIEIAICGDIMGLFLCTRATRTKILALRNRPMKGPKVNVPNYLLQVCEVEYFLQHMASSQPKAVFSSSRLLNNTAGRGGGRWRRPLMLWGLNFQEGCSQHTDQGQRSSSLFTKEAVEIKASFSCNSERCWGSKMHLFVTLAPKSETFGFLRCKEE